MRGMKTAALLLATLLIALAPLTLTEVSAIQPEQLTITIKTLDDKPLQGAIVEVYNVTSGVRIFRGTTDSSGQVTPTIIHNETYTMKVYYPPGYKVYNKHFVYDDLPDHTVQVDVLSKWTIRVYDSEGRDPVKDANVTLTHQLNDSVTFSGLTGSDGKIVFGPLPVGEYHVKVYYKDRTYDEGTKSLSLGNQETTLHLSLYRVTVRVKDIDQKPVENVVVSIRRELDEPPVSTATSDENGEAILKLVPKGKYYVEAKFKEYVVRKSDSKILNVLDDTEMDLMVNAVRLNVTVYDADGKDVIAGDQFNLRGELRGSGDILVAEAETTDGTLSFGHVPIMNFTLRVTLGDLTVYSATYEVKKETSLGKVNGKFYDITLKVNTTGLANETMAKYLKGTLKRSGLEFRFKMRGGKAVIENVPSASDYSAELFFDDSKVGGKDGITISKEDQEVTLPLTSYKVNVYVTNLKGKPLSADISVELMNGTQVTLFKTGKDGRGSSNPLLPTSYRLTVFFDEIKVGEKEIDLKSDMNLTLQASMTDIVLRIYDSDQEDALPGVNVRLQAGAFKKEFVSGDDGEALLENLPLTVYKLTAWYYGFKVLDTSLEVSTVTPEIDLKAVGVLDARLKFVDSVKKPLDGGTAVLTVGDRDIEVELNEAGEARVKNLPNSTIYVKLLYRDVEVKTDPSEFDLNVDEKSVTFVARVHSLTVSVLRGDDEPLRDGVAEVYVNGEPVASHNLIEENIFTERLPEGEVHIKIEFRGRTVGDKTLYLEEPMKELTLKTNVYVFGMTIYDISRNPVKGAEIIAKDKLGKVGEAASDEKGHVMMLLPKGSYTFQINYGNTTINYVKELKGNTLVNILYPGVESGSNFITIMAAALVNIAVAVLVVLKSVKGMKAGRRGGRPRRRRKVPRI